MNTTYVPRVDDYVKWNRNGSVDEGWVYFKCDEYITIEVRVKDKPKCEYTVVEKHKKIHVLVVCQHWYWNELEYVKNRRTIIENSFSEYKSQEGRYVDVQ